MAIPDDYNMGVIGELFEATQVAIAATLLVSGVGMLILGIIAATTGMLTGLFEMTVSESWRIAGILAGLGLPLVIVGVFTVLPATDGQRLGAAAGLGLVVIGVVLFALSFPNQWYGDETDRTFLVTAVYFLGTMLTIVYLFLAVANLQTPSTAQNTRRTHVHHSRQNQNPQTATALVKGVIGMLLDDTDDDGPVENDVNLDTVATTLEDTLTESINSVEQQDDHLIIERADDESHAQFTTRLPQYVEIVERDGQSYALEVDGFTFQMLR